MPKNDVKVSLYFPKSLYDRFEALRVKEGIQIGAEFSKNKFALRIIEKYIDFLEDPESAGALEKFYKDTFNFFEFILSYFSIPFVN